MLRYLAFAVATFFGAALCVYAQSSGSGAPPSQSSPSSPAPSESAAPSTPAKSPDKDSKKPKKVWTNDEISGLNRGVSVVGEDAKAKPPKSSNTQSGANASEISRLRKELQKLRADLEKIDKQIHEAVQCGRDHRLRRHAVAPRVLVGACSRSNQTARRKEKMDRGANRGPRRRLTEAEN